MPWWRKLLALLGLTNDARVHVRAKGIDVVITGEPRLVKRVLESVRDELENRHKKRKLGAQKPVKFQTDSHMVLPTDLDEMDSPYIIPEHRTVPPDQVKALPKKLGTQVATDDDIVATRDETSDLEDPPTGEHTQVDAPGPPGAFPMPQIAPSASRPDSIGPESSTSEAGVEFSDSGTENITADGDAMIVADEFTDSGSDRGTDPDLQAEAEVLKSPTIEK